MSKNNAKEENGFFADIFDGKKYRWVIFGSKKMQNQTKSAGTGLLTGDS